MCLCIKDEEHLLDEFVGDGVNEHVKTIARLEHMNMNKAPDAHFTRMKAEYKRSKVNGAVPVSFKGDDGSKNETAALVYHYSYRSYKEYLFKRIHRGRATVNSTHPSHESLIGQANGREIPAGKVYDNTAWEAMKILVPKYRYHDELFPDPPPLQV